jgi:CheY-like chemotaxis protein
VLIVDDNEDNRDVYSRYLAHLEYRIATAANAAEALMKVAALRPDIIVLDLGLPGVDGWEVTRRLKADSATVAIPIVALTGHALDSSERLAREAGVDGYLTKPCLPQDLGREIERRTGGPGGRRNVKPTGSGRR